MDEVHAEDLNPTAYKEMVSDDYTRKIDEPGTARLLAGRGVWPMRTLRYGDKVVTSVESAVMRGRPPRPRDIHSAVSAGSALCRIQAGAWTYIEDAADHRRRRPPRFPAVPQRWTNAKRFWRPGTARLIRKVAR